MTRWQVGTVLCVGEPLIALTPEHEGSLESTPTLAVSEGGAELNVAIHLARLGVAVRYAGRAGEDPLGRRLRRTLEREGVDASMLELDPSLPTGLYLKEPGDEGTAVHYYRRGSAATAFGRLPDDAMAGVTLIHVTGIVAAISETCRRLVETLLSDTRSAQVSFDVNYRRGLWPPGVAAPVLLALARRADIVFVGLDEARLLWDAGHPRAVRALFREPGEVIVKDGARPAVAFIDDAPAVVEPVPAVDVVEPVGAGDAFAAGYLATRRDGGDVHTALRVGHALAAGVLRTRSDHGGPPDPRLLAAARVGRPLADPGPAMEAMTEDEEGSTCE